MTEEKLSLDALRREEKVPTIIVDQNGVVVFVNSPFEAVFGWQANEMIGELVTKIIPASMHDAHNLGFSRFVTTGQPRLMHQPLKLAAIGKDGEVFEAEHYLIAEKEKEKEKGQWRIGASIRPL